MTEATLPLPKTLHRNIETLAERENISLTQRIAHLLNARTSDAHGGPVAFRDDATEQKASFDDLLGKWGTIPALDADEILDARQIQEPEPGLTPELVDHLKARIAHAE
uniref:Uncharacterized protein n=1 Tax=Candidatus Kentrum sp. FM TaxID=2126340 RepID=A0A450WL94_9GAMM|nr:MAG: hypothetical protein BECKFM1743A_GA0114220_104963 [Candidatus Kentron sp. FM]VFJ69048.1 MAG: hypothetical protein BECKFM1743C_GA0114222_105093 [Candidatus Kentron sp. FM]VFK17769.1 MAG: hypothetical protein BECKFM1743B_GA0114221_105013 [Candidatus Kentron sp. FM]